MEEEKGKIRSFKDLFVYQNTYNAMFVVFQKVLNILPAEEKYDLSDQLRRASKAIPRLIAEGYAKRHQKAGFTKYLDDAMAECNEMIVSLEQARDLYKCNPETINNLVEEYDKSARQLYKLAKSWKNFNRDKR